MSIERQLLEALLRYAADRQIEMDFGSFSDLIIPLKDGTQFHSPMILLTTAPEGE